jgi:hypothetical protein
VTKRKKVDQPSSVTPYQPTQEERTAVHAFFDRKKQRLPSPNLKVSKKGHATEVSLNHPEPRTGLLLLLHALGSTDSDFLKGLLTQLASASSKGTEADETVLNFMLSVIKAIEPKDEVETMIAAQMAAIHVATMTFARRLSNVENIPQQDSAERALNKLARTFAAQVEALKRYRTGGEQKVAVQHVTVSDNAQAIVGNVSAGGGGKKD